VVGTGDWAELSALETAYIVAMDRIQIHSWWSTQDCRKWVRNIKSTSDVKRTRSSSAVEFVQEGIDVEMRRIERTALKWRLRRSEWSSLTRADGSVGQTRTWNHKVQHCKGRGRKAGRTV
jgi:hypothetical protein